MLIKYIPMFFRRSNILTRGVSLRSYSSSGARSQKSVSAIVASAFGDESVLQIGNVNIPSPGSGQCVIRVHACGVNPVDTYIRSGVYPKLPDLPYIPGKDAAGVVSEVGSDVKDIKVGDRVYVFGALTGSYAQFTLCNSSNTFKLPGNVSYEEGACLGTPAFTAFRALYNKARGQPGDVVFVHGASGGVGLMAVQMARAGGMRVVGTASSHEGMQVFSSASFTSQDVIIYCNLDC